MVEGEDTLGREEVRQVGGLPGVHAGAEAIDLKICVPACEAGISGGQNKIQSNCVNLSARLQVLL